MVTWTTDQEYIVITNVFASNISIYVQNVQSDNGQTHGGIKINYYQGLANPAKWLIQTDKEKQRHKRFEQYLEEFFCFKYISKNKD